MLAGLLEIHVIQWIAISHQSEWPLLKSLQITNAGGGVEKRETSYTVGMDVGAVQFSGSVTSDSATPWTEARQVSLSITSSWSLLKLMSTESVMPSSHLILCRPLLLLPSIFPSIRVFSSESALHIRWPKYWSFSFSISPSNEDLGLISFRMDWLDLLAVHGTLKSLLLWRLWTVNTTVQKHQYFGTQLYL